MKNFIQIKKIALYASVVFVIFFIGTLVLMSFAQKELFINAHKQNLQMLANEKAFQVNNFFESQKEKQAIISSISVFKEAVLFPNDIIKITEAKKVILEIKNYFPGIGILTKEGILVAGENNPTGTDYSFMPQFPINNKSVIMFMYYYDLQRKKDYYGIFGPFYDEIEKNKLIGAIGFDVELNNISVLMKETLDMGKNDEVYLINENGLLLSGSKYIDTDNKDGVLIQEVESNGAKACLGDLEKYRRDGFVEEHQEEVIQYTNYMGNKVFGAHAYVPSIMGCVIAEESADEITKFSMMDYIKNILKIKNEVNDEE